MTHCKHCKLKLLKKNLQRHLNTIHGKVIELFGCPQCDNKFYQTPGNYKSHFKCHHVTKKKSQKKREKSPPLPISKRVKNPGFSNKKQNENNVSTKSLPEVVLVAEDGDDQPQLENISVDPLEEALKDELL